MTWPIALSVASILITMIVGFGGMMRTIGRLEQKFDIMWAWYLSETSSQQPGGQRRSDPPQRWEAHDDGGQRSG